MPPYLQDRRYLWKATTFGQCLRSEEGRMPYFLPSHDHFCFCKSHSRSSYSNPTEVALILDHRYRRQHGGESISSLDQVGWYQLVALILAPRLRRTRTHEWWPWTAATKRGVNSLLKVPPLPASSFGLAPASTSISSAAARPS